jgi:hypothetical protein
MSTLIGIITLGAAVILQSTLVVRFNLINGAADLVLLILVSWLLHEGTQAHWQWGLIAGLLVGFISQMPIWLTVTGYLVVVLVVRSLLVRIWQTPLLVLFFFTLVGSLIVMGLDYSYLAIIEGNRPLWDTINLVIIPSIVLNLIFVLPVYAVMGEFTRLIFPPAVEV